jgi:uncharacterized protein (DUF2132 family)
LFPLTEPHALSSTLALLQFADSLFVDHPVSESFLRLSRRLGTVNAPEFTIRTRMKMARHVEKQSHFRALLPASVRTPSRRFKPD